MSTVMKGLFVFACMSLTACAAPVDSTEKAPVTDPASTHSGPAAPEGPNVIDHVRSTGNEFTPPKAPADSTFFCRKDAFCEDFEEQNWKSRWADAITTPGGRIEMGQLSASPGRRSLRLYSNDDAAAAFLFQPKGDVSGSWSGALELAFRVDTIPGKYLGGPELTVKTPEGPITIRLALKPEGLVLEQLSTEACLRDRCTASSKIIAPSKENHWYRVRVGLEVNARQAAPYGIVEATVDGGELQATDLTVPLYDGSVFLRAGVTQGDARPAFAEIDDISLLVR
jgi:hypothetical protein